MCTHIRLCGFMSVRRDASLVVEITGHVGISIFMVYTVVEKVKVAEIRGVVLAEGLLQGIEDFASRGPVIQFGDCEPGV